MRDYKQPAILAATAACTLVGLLLLASGGFSTAAGVFLFFVGGYLAHMRDDHGNLVTRQDLNRQIHGEPGALDSKLRDSLAEIRREGTRNREDGRR